MSRNFYHVTRHVLADSTALVSFWSYDDFTLLKSLIPTTFVLVISSGNVTMMISSGNVTMMMMK